MVEGSRRRRRVVLAKETLLGDCEGCAALALRALGGEEGGRSRLGIERRPGGGD